MRLESHLQLLIQVLSPGGTLTRLQGSVSHPLARRRGEWKRRERGSNYIVSLEQETQLRVLQSTEKSLYTVQSNDIIADVIMTNRRSHFSYFLSALLGEKSV